MSEKNYLNNLRIQSLGYIIIHEAEEEVNQRRNNALKTAAIGAGAGLAGGAYAASPHGQNMIRRVGQGISNMARPTNQPNTQTQQGAANQQNATTAATTNAVNQAGNNAQNTGGAIPQDATSAIPNQVEWYRGRDILSSGANANRTLTNTAWGQNLKPQQPTAQPQTNQQTQQPQQNTTQPNQAQPVQQPVQQAAQPTNQAQPAQPAQPTQQPVQPAPQQPQATPVTPERPVQYALPGQPQQPNWMPNQSTPDVERQFNQAAADLNNRTNATPNVGNVNAGGNSASGTVKDVTLDPNTPVPNNVSYTPSYVPPSLETSTTFNRSMPSPFGPRTSDSVQLGREADTINAPNLNIGLGNRQGVFDQTFRQDGQPTGYLDAARNSGINTPNPVRASTEPSVWDRVRGWFSSDKDDASQDTPTSDGEQSFLDKVYGGLADGYKRLTGGISKLNTPPDASYTPPKIDPDDYV